MQEEGWEGAVGGWTHLPQWSGALGAQQGLEHRSGQREEQQEMGENAQLGNNNPRSNPKTQKWSLARGVAQALKAKAVSRGSGIFFSPL